MQLNTETLPQETYHNFVILHYLYIIIHRPIPSIHSYSQSVAKSEGCLKV